jgi:hypothetical protein
MDNVVRTSIFRPLGKPTVWEYLHGSSHLSELLARALAAEVLRAGISSTMPMDMAFSRGGLAFIMGRNGWELGLPISEEIQGQIIIMKMSHDILTSRLLRPASG